MIHISTSIEYLLANDGFVQKGDKKSTNSADHLFKYRFSGNSTLWSTRFDFYENNGGHFTSFFTVTNYANNDLVVGSMMDIKYAVMKLDDKTAYFNFVAVLRRAPQIYCHLFKMVPRYFQWVSGTVR
jgi:hypothetical protein